MTLQDSPKLSYSIAEIVRLTGLARSSIYRAINAGPLRARKCGRRTIVLASDLQTFLTGLREVA